MGIQNGFGYGSRDKGVGLDKDSVFGFIQFPDDGLCASTVRGKVDLPSGGSFLG